MRNTAGRKGGHEKMVRTSEKTWWKRIGADGTRPFSLLSAVLVLIFLCQFAVLCYLNFTQIQNHTGYDSSWNYLRTALMWQEKAVTFHNWHDDTTLQLDTHMPLSALLYGLTGNIWFSFGVGNTLMNVLMLLFLWKVLVRLNVRFPARMIALNLLICPFLTNGFHVFNDLGYFSSILSGASFYSLRMLLVLMIVYEFLKIVQDGRMGFLPCLIWAGCILCGISSGVYLIVIILAPFLAYVAEMAAIRNDWRQLIRRESIFACLCCAAVLAGKLLARFALRFEAIDSTSTWTSLTDLWKNFGALLPGYLKLLQALPVSGTEFPIVSLTGILRFGALAIASLTVFSMTFIFRKAWKNPEEKGGALLLLVNIVLVNLLILGLHNASYGAEIFEERYLIIVYFAAVIMTALFFNQLNSRRVLSVTLTAVLAGSVFMVDVHSDLNYLKETNDDWPMNQIQSLAESEDAGIVYVWGDDLTVICRTLRVWDLNRIYKSIPDGGGYYRHHWGDYYTYDTNEEYTGPTMLVCPKGQNLVPEKVLAEYTLLDDSLGYRVLTSVGTLDIYICDHNPSLW